MRAAVVVSPSGQTAQQPIGLAAVSQREMKAPSPVAAGQASPQARAARWPAVAAVPSLSVRAAQRVASNDPLPLVERFEDSLAL